MDGPEGRLPTYIGIGAARCASTSIHSYLGEHPDVCASRIKETNFLYYEGRRQGQFRVRSSDAYLNQFAGPQKAAGEFSPNYMNHISVAPRIRKEMPDARLIVSLRAPAERAFSHWVHAVRIGRETRPQAETLRPGTLYVESSFYRERLQPYLNRFPREQILIVLYEDFRDDPIGVMSRIYEHVGVDPGFKPEIETHHNAASYPRHHRLNDLWQRARRLQPYWFRAPQPLVELNARLLERSQTAPPELDHEVGARLDVLYRGEIERMEALLGRDLDLWRADSSIPRARA